MYNFLEKIEQKIVKDMALEGKIMEIGIVSALIGIIGFIIYA